MDKLPDLADLMQISLLWDGFLLSGTGLLRPLRAILGAGLHPLGDALGIQSAADNVVTDTRKVLYTAATDEDDAVLLQIVADTGNIRGNLDIIG